MAALSYGVLIGVLIGSMVLHRLLIYPFRRWRSTRLNDTHGCIPPPKIKSRDPFLGLDAISRLRRAVNEHRFLKLLPRIFEESGSWTVEANLVGKTTVWIADPENIKTVLATNSKDWHVGQTRKDAVIPIFGLNIIVSEGDYWHQSRSLIRPAFARKQFDDMAVLDRHVSQFLARLPRDHSPIDLKPLFYMLSMDVSTEFLFGISTHNLSAVDDPEGARFAEAFDTLQSSIIKGQYLGKVGALLFPNRKLKEAGDTVIHCLEKYIKKATSSFSPETKDKKYCLLNEMSLAWTTQPQRIRNESMVLLLGGRDTTAAALSNLFYHLARKPEIWEKIRRECLSAQERPSFEDIKGLSYLNNCIREGLRMVNPTLDISRTAAVDTILPRGGGPDGQAPVYISKGTDIQLWIYAVQHRKDIWGPDTDEFRPERWKEYRTTSWAYCPFGGGPRICVGQQLALTESMYTVFRMAREFTSIESVDHSPWEESLGLVTTSINGNHVRLVRA